MNKLLFLLIILSVYGCATIAQPNTSLRHESSEDRLLTEAEFMNRVSQSATLINEGLSAIYNAAKQYANDNNGNLPQGPREAVRSLLLDEGYLEEWPVVPAFAFTDPVQLDLRYDDLYDDLDGNGKKDKVIYARELKLEVCKDFVRRYSSPGFGDNIYDFEAAGKKYPGGPTGRHIKVYAVIWSKDRVPDNCDVLRVVEYTGFPDQ